MIYQDTFSRLSDIVGSDLKLMSRTKKAYDPEGILNPGKMTI